MSGTYAFVIVGPNDCPVYTADLSQLGGASSQSRQHRNDEQQHLYQFVLQASLDVIQETVWTSQNMFLKVVDTFNEYSVSAHVTAGRTKLLLLHDRHLRNEDGVRLFLAEVYDLYLRVMLNQLQMSSSKIVNETAFDARVRSFAKKHF